MSKYSDLVFVIPALNEETSLAKVLSELSVFADTIVVDDGSTDNTSAIASSKSKHVVKHERNLGYEQAIVSGLQAANSFGYKFAITIDADGQHNASVVPEIMSHFESGADLVVGVRDRMQRISERLFGLASTLLWGVKDPLCGLKGYRLAKFPSFDNVNQYRSVGTEIFVRFAKSGFVIKQITINTRDRAGSPRIGRVLSVNFRITYALLMGIFVARKY